MSNNRRILNATPVVSDDGIQMTSKVELRIYNALRSLGFSPLYEAETFTYWKGPRPVVPFYDMAKNRHLRNNMKKLIDMSYTPDFTFMYEGVKVIIEVKGWENDQFAIRKKLFRKYLETLDYPVVYAEIFTRRQLLEFIEELKQIAPLLKAQKQMILTVKKKTPKAIAVIYDGHNLKEIITMLGMQHWVRDKGFRNSDDYIAKVEAGEQRAYAYHPTCGSVEIRPGNVIVLDGNLLFMFANEEQFRATYETVQENA